MKPVWDVVVVGAGPAGASAALGALAVDPRLSVLLLDREDFPRDKACGDGIAPHVLDLLADVGVTGVLDDWTPVRRFCLERGSLAVDRELARPTWVVPRTVFDERLVAAARSAGAQLVRHRVRDLRVDGDTVLLDGSLTGRIVIGADGAHSVVRRVAGGRRGPTALALRGYAPTPPNRSAQQAIVYGPGPQPSYAWSFDRGDGLSNVGYGEALTGRRQHPTRTELLNRLEDLLPGATDGGTDWRAHHLPLTSWSWRPGKGRVLLTGDAAGLVNPMTGEGIYYAVATGLSAGRAAAGSLRDGDGRGAGTAYRQLSSPLNRHFRHTALAALLTQSGRVLDAGIRAAAADQQVFDDLVELGLADGGLTRPLVRGLFGR
ncbi:geranylgeranyl reductase family protein [Kribbella amoyensis]|uniref:Geranylgeranyl reductase family protein n=1 Tax=Kribbella amoyensis TaxID=996641 RepID=A0A561BU59_9ACTN|nr:geranylgeranyl reductase family protein [Kribbella amoyensis]TWD82470.1 geranylgeranyl reductase family protein [Kribbella amoyensis]